MSRSSLETYTSEVSLATGSSSKAQFAMGHDSNPDDQQDYKDYKSQVDGENGTQLVLPGGDLKIPPHKRLSRSVDSYTQDMIQPPTCKRLSRSVDSYTQDMIQPPKRLSHSVDRNNQDVNQLHKRISLSGYRDNQEVQNVDNVEHPVIIQKSLRNSIDSLRRVISQLDRRMLKQLGVFTTTPTDFPLHMRILTSFGSHGRENSSPAVSSVYTDITTEHHNQEVPLNFPDDKMMNEVMHALMYIKETPSKLLITMRDLKEKVILCERVSCNLVLAVNEGLPMCGKSHLIHKIMNKFLISPIHMEDMLSPQTPLQSYVPDGLSSYGVIIVGRKPFHKLTWMGLTPRSMHTFAVTSSILHDSLLEGQEVELVDIKLNIGKRFKAFEDEELNRHLHNVYNDVDRVLRHGDLNPEIKRILPSGVTHVNVIDMGTNRGAYDFLTVIARYCSRQFGFVFLSLERDVPLLAQPPNIEYQYPTNIAMMQSRLFYLIRFAAVTYFATEDHDSPSTVFIALHEGSLSPDSIAGHISILKQELKSEVSRQGLPLDVIGEVKAINPDDDGDMDDFKIFLETLVKKRSSAMLNLKLSLIFLRSFFYSIDRLSVPLLEVKRLARQLEMKDEDIDEFLHVFTGYGSILFIPDILPGEVIIQPAVFINHICRVLNPQKEANRLHAANGLISKAEVKELIGDEATKVVVPAICNAGLAVEINASKMRFPELRQSNKEESEYLISHHKGSKLSYLFIPSARIGSICQVKEQSSLFIVHQSKVIPPDMIGMFVQKFMISNTLTVQLYPTEDRNAVSLVLPKGFTLILVFHEDSVELKLQSRDPKDLIAITTICTEVLMCCVRALSGIRTFFPDLSYRYALLCLDSSNNTINKYEFLPQPVDKLCQICKNSVRKDTGSQRKAWYDTVQDKEKTAEYLDVMSLDNLTKVATDLTGILTDRRQREELASACSIDQDEASIIMSKYSGKQQLLMILLAWMTKTDPSKATKQKLFDILFRVNPSALKALK